MTLEEYRGRLQKALNPSVLEVVDGSAAHQGHAGAANAGPVSHLGVRIQAECLKGLSMVQQHQKIHAVVCEELASGVLHAIQIQVLG